MDDSKETYENFQALLEIQKICKSEKIKEVVTKIKEDYNRTRLLRKIKDGYKLNDYNNHYFSKPFEDIKDNKFAIRFYTDGKAPFSLCICDIYAKSIYYEDGFYAVDYDLLDENGNYEKIIFNRDENSIYSFYNLSHISDIQLLQYNWADILSWNIKPGYTEMTLKRANVLDVFKPKNFNEMKTRFDKIINQLIY